MDRRAFLAMGAGALTSLAGCVGSLGGGGETTTTGPQNASGPTMADDLPSDDNPNDGLAPEFDRVPEAQEFDESGFRTVRERGQDVKLAPIEATYNWYARREARFADARAVGQYQNSHVLGAVSAPVTQQGYQPGPTADWSKDDRVVCYCGCPHHLSSMLAGSLKNDGFSNVYVIDEGFWEWHGRKYPMAGSDVGNAPAAVTVVGEVNPAHAGGNAWVVHDATDQQEAAPIDPDGGYTLHVKFSDVTDETPVTLRTPAYEFEAPLGDLAADVVTGPPRT